MYVGPFRNGHRCMVVKEGQRITKVFKLKRDAIAWGREMEAKKTFRTDRSLRLACDKYLETVTPTKRNAIDYETRRFDALCAYLGDDKPMVEITSDDIGGWRDWRLAGEPDKGIKPVSGSTVMREINLYRNMFKLASTEWRWIPISPFVGVRLPKENPSRDAVWRWQEIRRILRAGQRSGGKILEVTQAFHISLRTSMRLQEALVAPEHFAPRHRVVRIPPSKANALSELIPLTPQAVRLLERLPKKFAVEPNEASTLFAKLRKQQLIKGLEFRDARATALTLMARKMDILTLARISRHKNLELLRKTYYRETPQEISARLQEEAMRRGRGTLGGIG